MNFKITVLPENRIITAEKNSCLSHVLIQNGISISAPCGGNGKCGKCKVKLIKASAGDLKPDSNGMIKSCKTVITEDLIIEIPNTLSNEISLWCSSERPPENAELGVALDIGTT
ncbi:MAG: 2Fe-2S iron-sulfur cluster-binding protein, partial [Acutalibacteraceae bacterium]|nr:2Fe-2S iron-sulfur cluster-binding protein [Acutalibacteraceae bacterium]